MTDNSTIQPLIRVKRDAVAKAFELPCYETEGAAGMDLRATVPVEVTLEPGERALIPTGLYVEIPVGFEMQVRPRSGLALKHGITVLNSPGTIDADYRGEVGVILVNLGQKPFTVEPGMRIAQAVFARAVQVQLHEVDTLSETTRGERGFGSSGVHSTEVKS